MSDEFGHLLGKTSRKQASIASDTQMADPAAVDVVVPPVISPSGDDAAAAPPVVVVAPVVVAASSGDDAAAASPVVAVAPVVSGGDGAAAAPPAAVVVVAAAPDAAFTPVVVVAASPAGAAAAPPAPVVVVAVATAAATVPTFAPVFSSVDIAHVPGADVVVGLRWDYYEGQDKVDLDASALVFDDCGVLLDAAYYNQLVCMHGAVHHSGDNKSGDGAGDDERIAVDVDALPKHASHVVIVINAFRGGTFANVESAYCTVTGMGDFEVGSAGTQTGIIAFVLHRKPHVHEQWQVRRIDATCGGTNFDESMPAIRDALGAASLIDPALLHSRDLSLRKGAKSFNMEKGDCCTIPANLFTGGDDFFIGLGWDCGPSIDLDASVIVADSFDGGKAINIVSFSDKEFGEAVRHQGDNTTGDGKGDDEVIMMDLDCMPKEVKACYIVVNIYSSGKTFRDVRNAYMRLVACSTHQELARYSLHKGILSRGVLFAKIRRAPSASGSNRAWHLETLGTECDGGTATSFQTLQACGITGMLDSNEIRRIEHTATARHHPQYGRGISSRMGGGGGGGGGQPDDGCCVIG